MKTVVSKKNKSYYSREGRIEKSIPCEHSLSSHGKPRDAKPRSSGQIIRIYHECEGRIENSILRITFWHHEACQVMTKGDP